MAKRAASEASRERSELVTTSVWCCLLASLASLNDDEKYIYMSNIKLTFSFIMAQRRRSGIQHADQWLLTRGCPPRHYSAPAILVPVAGGFLREQEDALRHAEEHSATILLLPVGEHLHHADGWKCVGEFEGYRRYSKEHFGGERASLGVCTSTITLTHSILLIRSFRAAVEQQLAHGGGLLRQFNSDQDPGWLAGCAAPIGGVEQARIPEDVLLREELDATGTSGSPQEARTALRLGVPDDHAGSGDLLHVRVHLPDHSAGGCGLLRRSAAGLQAPGSVRVHAGVRERGKFVSVGLPPNFERVDLRADDVAGVHGAEEGVLPANGSFSVALHHCVCDV